MKSNKKSKTKKWGQKMKLLKHKKVLFLVALLIAGLGIASYLTFAESQISSEDTSTDGQVVTLQSLWASSLAAAKSSGVDLNPVLNPINGSSDADLTGPVTVTFPFDVGIAFGPEHASLYQNGDIKVETENSYSSDKALLSLNPGSYITTPRGRREFRRSYLKPSTIYYVRFDDEATQYVSQLTSTAHSSTSFNFKTYDGTTATATQSPADGNVNVSRGVQLKITFSEYMNKSTINTETIHLRKYSDDSIVPIDIIDSNPMIPDIKTSTRTYQISLKPKTYLAWGTKYYVDISPSVKDRSGRPFSRGWMIPFKSSHEFTTMPLETMPQKAANIAYGEYKKRVREHPMGSNNGTEVSIYQKAGGECYGGAWCAAFLSWAYQKAGAVNPPSTCGARILIDFFAKKDKNNRQIHSRWTIGQVTPQKGDVLWKKRNGGTGHVGIVYSVDTTNKTITTIEGNKSDRVSMIVYPDYGRKTWELIGRW